MSVPSVVASVLSAALSVLDDVVHAVVSVLDDVVHAVVSVPYVGVAVVASIQRASPLSTVWSKQVVVESNC